MAKWWEQDWQSLGQIPAELADVSASFQQVLDAWGADEPKARKGDDGGKIGARIKAYLDDKDSHDSGAVALLVQDLADFTEAAKLFLDESAVAVKWSAGTELPGFVSGVLKAVPLSSIVGELGDGFGPEAEAICTEAVEHWVAGGYQEAFVYSHSKDAIQETKVSFTVEDDLPKATANGFSVPSKIIGIDITFDKDGLFARNKVQLQAYLKKTDDRIDYWRGGGKVLVIEPDDAKDPAWLAIQRDSDAKKGRIKVGRAHLYAKDDAGDEKGAEAVRDLVAGLAGFTAGDGYKLDDGTDGVKAE